MVAEKNIKIIMNNGINLDIPRKAIAKIVLPSIVIKRNYFRLVLSMENYERELEKIKKRFNL